MIVLAMLRWLWPLSLGAFALGMDAYVPAGLLPDMASDLHTSEARAGLSIASFTAAYALAAPLLAPLAMHYSARSALLAGLSLFFLGNLASILAPNLWTMLMARWVAGVGAGFYSPLASSCAANMTAPAQRGRALSLVLAGLGIGTALGVPLGLWVESRYGWRYTIAMVMVLSVLAALGIALRRGALPAFHMVCWQTRLTALRSGFALYTLAVTLFTGFAALGVYTYIDEIARSRDMGFWAVWMIDLWGLGGLVGALSIGKVIDKLWPATRTTPLLLMGLACALGLFACAPLCWVLLGCFLAGLTDWASIPPQQHALVEHASEQTVALMAWNSSLNYLGGALGAMAGSWALAGALPASWLPLGAIVVLLIALLLHGLKLRSRPCRIK